MAPRNRTLDRRQVLYALAGLSTAYYFQHPVKRVITSILNGMIRKSQAGGSPYTGSASGSAPVNYIYLAFPNAPPRWLFDLPLCPYSSTSDLTPNTMVNTQFNASGTPVYATTPVTIAGQTLQMPSLWKSQIPTASGSWVPMTQLLQNMLILRGITMLSDGHQLDSIKAICPSSAPSLSGAVADISKSPIPAINLPGISPLTFISATGIGQANPSYADPLNQLLSPFDRTSDLSANPTLNAWLTRRGAFQNAIQTAFNAFCADADSNSPGMMNLCNDQARATQLLSAGVGNLSSTYSALLTKYNNLISSCLNPNYPIIGVTDNPVTRTNYSNQACVISNTSPLTVANNSDLRTIFTASTTVSLMADAFSVIEYVLLNGYSSCITGGIGDVINLNFSNLTTLTPSSGTPVQTNTWLTDEHFHGYVLSLLINSFKFRAFAACLNELITQLTNAGVWQQTVIHIGGEFNRAPRGDLVGSDHGWNGSVFSVLSGMIPSPMVLGNATVSNEKNYPGSWGMGAPGNIDGVQLQPNVGHATSTVAQLLGVAPPLPNDIALVLANGSSITPTTELAKNV